MKQKRKALIVSVSEYKDKHLQNLEFCKNDGRQMIVILKNLGYEIMNENNLIGKVSGLALKNSIVDFFSNEQLTSTDTVLFYFSGHGVPSQMTGEVYLASSDINAESPLREGFGFNYLTTVMNECKSRRVITILDCCYSGKAKVGKGIKSNALIANQTINENKENLKEGTGKVLLCASLDFQQAYDSPIDNLSLFTDFLIKGLKGADGKSLDKNYTVTPSSLIEYMDDEFDKLSDEQKYYQTPIRKGESTGRIILADYSKSKPSPKPKKSIEGLIQDGGHYLDNRKFNDAISSYDEVIEKDPKNVTAWNNRGLAYEGLIRYSLAVECYECALKIDPNSDDVWYNKGNALSKLGEYKESLECYNRAIELKSDEPDYYYNRDQIRDMLGRRKPKSV